MHHLWRRFPRDFQGNDLRQGSHFFQFGYFQVRHHNVAYVVGDLYSMFCQICKGSSRNYLYKHGNDLVCHFTSCA